ncbi:MAG: M12 family metallo-peptidase [Woeseiaceae bacterium]|nr:M12 family metallo-peptidase [Woeseiaceae bacterium]
MNALSRIAAISLIGFTAASYASAMDDVSVLHVEPLQKLEMARPGADGLQKLTARGPVSLRFDAMGRVFDLELETNSRLLSASARTALGEDFGVYRGALRDVPGSWARIVVADGVPAGLIWDGTELFAIESPADSRIAADSAVIYRLADAVIRPGTMSCGADLRPGNGAAVYEKLQAELGTSTLQGPGAVSELTLGAIGDYEFTTDMGGDTAANQAIVTRLNSVDGIFSQQLGVQISLEVIETNSDVNDPFSDVLDAGDLLVELGTYRNNTAAQRVRGLTHLYTGRNLDTSTVGIAYGSALCSTRFGAGLSEGRRGPTTDALIAAHEIGHNFGAPHDGESGSPCESETGAFLMAPSVNGSDQFSSCSITQMQDDVAAASCITALPATDMSVAFSGPGTTILLDAPTDLVFDVDNQGSLDAANVSVDFTIPAALTVNAIAASSGSCSTGAGTANCSLGTVAGFAGNTVTISVTPNSLGSAVLNATVSADVDDNSRNDQSTTQFTIDPATDLRVFGTGTTNLVLDGSTTLRPTLQNQSDLAATGVTVSIAFSSGLRADSADWSLGTCTVISSSQIDCAAGSFAAQSSSTLSIGITGTSAGSRSYTVTVASNESDVDPTNNSATGAVNVNEPGSNGGGDDGGGGATGPFLFLLLALQAAFCMRRRSNSKRVP